MSMRADFMPPVPRCSEVARQNDVMGQELPRQPKSLAAALPLITDTKAGAGLPGLIFVGCGLPG